VPVRGDGFGVVADAAAEQDVRHAVGMDEPLRYAGELRLVDPTVIDFFHVALLVEREHRAVRPDDRVPLYISGALLCDNLRRARVRNQANLDAAFLFERLEDRLVLGILEAAAQRRDTNLAGPLDGALSAHEGRRGKQARGGRDRLEVLPAVHAYGHGFLQKLTSNIRPNQAPAAPAMDSDRRRNISMATNSSTVKAMTIVDAAAITGVISSQTPSHIFFGKVTASVPERKIAITTSSNDARKASSAAVPIPGEIKGNVIRRNANQGGAPRPIAARARTRVKP